MIRILDGRAIARRMLAGLRPRVRALTRRLGRPPCLALAACGRGSEAAAYFGAERRACARLGVRAREVWLPARAGTTALARQVAALSRDPGVDGILLSVPLPRGVDAKRVLAALDPAKDVEGLTPLNQGRLYGARTWADWSASRAFAPCTALALARLARTSGLRLRGARALVLGRSTIVGRPAAHLLTCLDATVTLAHSKTRGLARLAADVDLLVAAAGRPGLVKAGMVRRGAVVLDAGATWKAGRARGDVDFAAVSRKAGAITPVPGGVGPVTVAELLNAVVTAAERRAKNGRAKG